MEIVMFQLLKYIAATLHKFKLPENGKMLEMSGKYVSQMLRELVILV